MLNGVDPGLVDTIEQTAAAVPGVQVVDAVQLRWEGHRLRGELAIGVDPGLDVAAAHQLAHEVEHELLHQLPHLDAMVVHPEPVGPAREASHRLLSAC